MSGHYTESPFPLERKIIVDAVRIGHQRRIIHGLIKIDVTDARLAVRQQSLSFTGFLIACVGIAMGEYPEVHAMQNWNGNLITYHDVDISTLIETRVNEKNFPVAHVIRRANQRSIADITQEIRTVQNQPQKSATLSYWKWLTRLFFRLPYVLRAPFYRVVMLNPLRIQKVAGSAVLTSVGMFGDGGGWGIGAGIPLHNFSITVGGIGQEPRLIDGQLCNREYLHVTLSFNHDIVDGAPAARFASRFKELVESCHGLEPIDKLNSIPV